MRISTLTPATTHGSMDTVATHIGSLLGSYGAHRMRRLVQVCAFISLIVAGIALVGVVISLHAHAYISASVGVMCAIVCGALALYAGVTIHAVRGVWIELGAEGFRLARAGVIMAARWEEIDSLRMCEHYLPWRRDAILRSYHLTLSNGQTVRIDHTFDRTKELGVMLRRKTTNALLPGALAAYERGEPVRFGRFSVTPWGISDGAQMLLWHAVRRVAFERGVFTISTGDLPRLWARVPVAEIPNIFLFTTLISAVPRA